MVSSAIAVGSSRPGEAERALPSTEEFDPYSRPLRPLRGQHSPLRGTRSIGSSAPIAVVRRTSVTGQADSVHSPMLC